MISIFGNKYGVFFFIPMTFVKYYIVFFIVFLSKSNNRVALFILSYISLLFPYLSYLKALFLPIVSLSLKLLFIINSSKYHNIISFILETCYTISDIKSIIYCNSWSLLVMGGLRLIIFLVLKFSYTLGTLRPGFYLRARISSIVNSLGLAIFFGKRYINIIDSLKSQNYIILLIYLSLSDNTLIIGFYIFSSRSITLAAMSCIFLSAINSLESTKFDIHWIYYFGCTKFEKY